MKPIKTLLFALIAMAVVACATFDGPNDSPKLRAFAVFSDYTAIAATADIYVNSLSPDPNIKARIKSADARAWPAIEVMMTVAGGEVPEFCTTSQPANVTPALAGSACNRDLPAVVRQTRLLVTLLITVVKETVQ